jgi:hypothetical protein
VKSKPFREKILKLPVLHVQLEPLAVEFILDNELRIGETFFEIGSVAAFRQHRSKRLENVDFQLVHLHLGVSQHFTHSFQVAVGCVEVGAVVVVAIQDVVVADAQFQVFQDDLDQPFYVSWGQLSENVQNEVV